jgi:O-antigen/teichoic acid export membrane protein
MLLRNVLKVISSEIATIPLGLVVGILTARFLGPSDRGTYTLLLMLPATATTFFNPGLDSATVYFHNKENVALGRLLSNSLTYVAVASVTICSLIWLFRNLLFDSFSGVTTGTLLVTMTIVPLRMLSQTLNGILKARHDFTRYSIRYVLEAVLIFCGMLTVFLIFDGRLMQCLIVYPLVLLSMCLWLSFDTQRYIRGLPRPDWALTKRMLRFGIKSYGAMLAKHVHFRSDIYLVGLYLTSAEIAYYSIGLHLAERLLMIPTTLSVVLFPRLSALSTEAAARLAGRVARNVFFISALTGFALVVVAGPLIRILYGDAYLPAVKPFYLVMTGVAAISITRNLANYFRSTNTHHYMVWVLLLSACLNVTLNALLIPHYRIMGAAFSSLVTYSLQAGLTIFFFRRLTAVPLRDVLIVDYSDLKYFSRLPQAFWRAALPIRPRL